MKTMKKVISVLLLVCVLASFATVSAYATEGGSETTTNTEVPKITQIFEVNGKELSKANGETFTLKAVFQLPEGKSWSDYTIIWSTESNLVTVSSSSTKADGNNQNTVTCATNYNTAAQNAYVAATLLDSNGNRSETKTIMLTFPAVAVPAPTAAPTPSSIKILEPASRNVRINTSIALEAEVKNGDFGYWEVANGSTGNGTFDVTSGNRKVNFTATAVGTVKVVAYTRDGTASAPLELNVTAARTPQVVCSVGRIDNGETATFWVNNAEDGETFTWSYVTSPATAQIITKATDRGVGLDLTGGKGEGTVTVTAKDKYGASGSVTVPVNVMDTGDAKLSPTNVTWSRGQGNLTFTVEPTMYSAYIDGVCITGSGNTNKYSYVYSSKNLVINSSYLATLSAGEHILRVDTVYNSGEGIGQGAGTVYAYITINGTASAAYGDNAHVRGTTGNLYFNSNGAIKNVYISNQLIDPANYTLSNNGKSVTLKANFLNLLNYGSYTMKLENTNGGTEKVNFRIVTANYAPATGDESNLAIWVAVLLISGVGAVALIPRRKKEM